jgi:phosphoadenosine phosphosulfate reductase
LIDAINTATDLALAKGLRVMQTAFIGDSQAAHVAYLLKLINPAPGAHIVDAGCGVGEVARLMHAERPDLTFDLVNVSEYQLKHAPDGEAFALHRVDFTRSGLPDASADVVMFNSALCQMPINQALSEARRLLKPGGQLFVCDLAITEYRELPELYATFMPADAWGEVIERHGFAQARTILTRGDMQHFAGAFDDFEQALPEAMTYIAQFHKQTLDDQMASAMDRHDRIAFQFSGGKDSLAALFLLKAFWPYMTVYWTNTGDPVPEVLAVVDQVRALVPNFVEISGRVNEQIAAHGLPSDLLPTTATAFGRTAYGGGVALQDRFNCCYHALMAPMHQRMLDDGITLIVRGQKSADTMKSPLRSGALLDGVELLFPLEHWVDAEVFDYLRNSEAFVPGYYEHLAASPDCLTCSAYWSEGRATWLKHKHPEAYQVYQGKLDVIRDAVMPHIALFNLEVSQ